MTDTVPTNLTRLTLPALVAQWARIVDYVARHEVATHDLAADLQVRHEIAQRLRARPTTLETREMLAELDEHFRESTIESADCVLGADRAAASGWSAGREWYLWRRVAGRGNHKPVLGG